MDDLDLIAPDVSRLIQLFSAQADLRFPDVDAAVLQAALLTVRERDTEVCRAEAALNAAKSALEEVQEQLLKKTHQAHAYLRVFAENDFALMEKVAAISLPKLRRTPRTDSVSPDAVAPAPAKRGRPKKVHAAEESLFPAPTAG